MKNKKIFGKKRSFIVAEISANHGQSIDRALKMIKVAKQCGADAVKFQAYTPETLTIDSRKKDFIVKHPEWGGQTLYELYEKAYTPLEWFGELKRAADREKIVFFATAFDKRTVDILENLDVPFHKISSFELVDIPLIEYISKTKKPLILSTGMASLNEMKEAVMAARSGGAKDITLLKCVSNYPADPDDMNLRTIPDIARRFKLNVGISDHTLDSIASVAAVALGATVVEKHFTLDRKIKTPDGFFSVEPKEFSDLVKCVRNVEKVLGTVRYGITQKEKKSRVFRRSLFVVEDIKKGDRFTRENVRSIRPSDGLHPRYLKKVLTKKAAKNIKKGTPLNWSLT